MQKGLHFYSQSWQGKMSFLASKLYIVSSSHLSDNVNAEIQALEIAHTKESTRHDLSNQITAQIDVFQRGESLQVDIFYGLKKRRREKKISIQFKIVRFLTKCVGCCG